MSEAADIHIVSEPDDETGQCPTCLGSGRVRGGIEFWIVQSGGFGDGRALNFWGPFPTSHEARQCRLYEPELGHVVVEVPA